MIGRRRWMQFVLGICGVSGCARPSPPPTVLETLGGTRALSPIMGVDTPDGRRFYSQLFGWGTIEIVVEFPRTFTRHLETGEVAADLATFGRDLGPVARRELPR